MHPKEMSSDNSSQRYTILNFAKVSVRHRGIAQMWAGIFRAPLNTTTKTIDSLWVDSLDTID